MRRSLFSATTIILLHASTCIALSSQKFTSDTTGLENARFLKELVSKSSAQSSLGPLARSVQFVPESMWSPDIVYDQKAVQVRIKSAKSLKESCRYFDESFQSDRPAVSKIGSDDNEANTILARGGVKFSLVRISSLESFSPTLDGYDEDVMNTVDLNVQWNVTWVPPTVLWLCNLPFVEKKKIVFRHYNDRSGEISTFSWKGVGRLLFSIMVFGVANVPIACIEGWSVLTFRQVKRNRGENNSQGECWKLHRIVEDLQYADELRRGRLLNRKCAQDLRLFLECGRKPAASAQCELLSEDLLILGSPNFSSMSWEEWESFVSSSFRWSEVPGNGVMDIESNANEAEKGELSSASLFGIVATLSLILFNMLALNFLHINS